MRSSSFFPLSIFQEPKLSPSAICSQNLDQCPPRVNDTGCCPLNLSASSGLFIFPACPIPAGRASGTQNQLGGHYTAPLGYDLRGNSSQLILVFSSFEGKDLDCALKLFKRFLTSLTNQLALYPRFTVAFACQQGQLKPASPGVFTNLCDPVLGPLPGRATLRSDHFSSTSSKATLWDEGHPVQRELLHGSLKNLINSFKAKFFDQRQVVWSSKNLPGVCKPNQSQPASIFESAVIFGGANKGDRSIPFGSKEVAYRYAARGLAAAHSKAARAFALRAIRALNQSFRPTNIPQPTQLYTVIRSPHVFKKTREQFARTLCKSRIQLNFKSKLDLQLLMDSLILLKLPVEIKILLKESKGCKRPI